MTLPPSEPLPASVAPLATVVVLLVLPSTISVPANTVLLPVLVLLAVRVRLPLPLLFRLPMPATTLEMVAVSPLPLVKVWVVPPARLRVPPVRTRPLA